MQPLHNRLVVKRRLSDAETSFGLILEQEVTDHCDVLAIGPKVENIKVGEVIILSKNVGQAIKDGDTWLTIVTEDDVLGIIDGND